MTDDKILDKIYQYFVNSHDFNGIPLTTLSAETDINYIELIDIIKNLVKNNLASIQSDVNPHIIRFSHYEKDKQLTILDDAKANKTEILDSFGSKIKLTYDTHLVCVYPSQYYLRLNRDVTKFKNLPYEEMLALGEPQLKPIFFEIEVLDRYFHDPRYSFTFEDYSGQISYKEDENHIPLVNEPDRVFIETFGLGQRNGGRVAVVYLRYLKRLSEEHQKFWKSKEVNTDCRMLKEYFDNTIIGEFTNSYSVFSAFIQEQKTVNNLTTAIFGIPLFNKTFEEDKRPQEFTFFFTPTIKNYNDFVLLLDKMLADNINESFFSRKIDIYEYRKIKDGLVERVKKGTIKLLEEWLSLQLRIKDQGAISGLLKPLKTIRQERQSPAHKIVVNKYDKNLIDKQKDLIRDSYYTMRALREIFQKHSKAKNIEIPDWLDKGDISIF